MANRNGRWILTQGSLFNISTLWMKGIVIDIEPQSLPEFESNPDLLMRHFTEGLTAAYQVANQKGLEVIVCLPYFFDTEGFSDELATIVQRASDQVAIMNYYRGKEIDHISNEASLSKQYQNPFKRFMSYKHQVNLIWRK